MPQRLHTFTVCVFLSAAAFRAHAEPPPETNRAPAERDIRVLDLVVAATNRIVVGTNTFSLAAATNHIGLQRGRLDLVTVHDLAQDGPPAGEASTLAAIVRAGVPLVIVEKDGEYAWREQSGNDGIRTVKVGTAQFAALRRLWQEKDAPRRTTVDPTVRATLQLDSETGAYELNRVELGLFGDRVWIMHERPGSADEPGSIGIQIRKEW